LPFLPRERETDGGILPTLVLRPGFNDGLFGNAGFIYIKKSSLAGRFANRNPEGKPPLCKGKWHFGFAKMTEGLFL